MAEDQSTAGDQPPPKKRMLYAEYQEGYNPTATISSAPVMYNQDDEASKKTTNNLALQFQPSKRRPQAQVRPNYMKGYSGGSDGPTVGAPEEGSLTAVTQKRTLGDFQNEERDEQIAQDYLNNQPARSRGGRKKKRNARHYDDEDINVYDPDEIYDPTKAINLKGWLHSKEHHASIAQWKAYLHEQNDLKYGLPPNRPSSHKTHEPYSDGSPASLHPQVGALGSSTGEDAYARRQQLSGMAPSVQPELAGTTAPHITQSHIAYQQPHTSHTISAAPVRYDIQQPAPATINADGNVLNSTSAAIGGGRPDTDRAEPQLSKAERMLAKHGWSRGEGLGARGTGITQPLFMVQQTNKKKGNAGKQTSEFARIAGTGRIVGGAKSKAAMELEEEERIAKANRSRVVRFMGLLNSLDDQLLQSALEDGSFMQSMGEECTNRFGHVEQVKFDVDTAGVFVLFASDFSAVQAMTALGEGGTLLDQSVTATYYSEDDFSAGNFEN